MLPFKKHFPSSAMRWLSRSLSSVFCLACLRRRDRRRRRRDSLSSRAKLIRPNFESVCLSAAARARLADGRTDGLADLDARSEPQ